MEQVVTLAKVQEAIKQLRNNGERVSRRNVRVITGGGMSTVHRLMSQVEEVEAFQAASLDQNISGSLQKAINAEIEMHVKKATEALHVQIRQLKNREDEALEALTRSENRVNGLEGELTELRDTLASERLEAEKRAAVASGKISAMGKELSDRQAEIRALTDALREAQIEQAKAQVRFEQIEKLIENSGGSMS